MTDLSFTAQAVLDAATEGFWRSAFNSESNGAAAVLRAAADQVVPASTGISYTKQDIRATLLAIADELEGVTYGTYRSDLADKPQ